MSEYRNMKLKKKTPEYNKSLPKICAVSSKNLEIQRKRNITSFSHDKAAQLAVNITTSQTADS